MTLNEQIITLAGGLRAYSDSVCRIVETQELAATLSLVDNLDEQAELERILDDYKPPYSEGTKARHYLISTPFRYPPLLYGSRFGTIFEPSFFYASENIACCLAEAAFYRFVLIDGTEKPFEHAVQSQHSVFFVEAKSQKTLDLTCIDDEGIQTLMQHPASYAATQLLGQHARLHGADLIRYYSARSLLAGINVAIDNHHVIHSDPKDMVSYLCETDGEKGIVRFSAPRTFPVMFRKEQFLIEGRFPSLA